MPQTLQPPGHPSRRALLRGSAGVAAAAVGFSRAHGMTPIAAAPARGSRYALEKDSAGAVETAVHGGLGRIRVKWFDFQRAARPSLLLTYIIPPGASEGVHTHALGDRALGAYDEFYYVLEGEGVMEIDGTPVRVTAGDHVFTPLGISHGIRNTARTGDLKVFLTAVERF